jgi:hypothetical protein
VTRTSEKSVIIAVPPASQPDVQMLPGGQQAFSGHVLEVQQAAMFCRGGFNMSIIAAHVRNFELTS